MPWKAIPFQSTRAALIAEKLILETIPRLVLLNKDGTILKADARYNVEDDPIGKSFPWKE